MPDQQLRLHLQSRQGLQENGVPKGTAWEDVPDDYKCKVCGASKKSFRPLAGPGSVAEDGI